MIIINQNRKNSKRLFVAFTLYFVFPRVFRMPMNVAIMRRRVLNVFIG